MNNLFEKKSRPSTDEVILIIIMAIFMLLTLNFPLTFAIFLLSFIGMGYIKLFYSKIKTGKKEIDFVLKIWITALIFTIIDTLSTYYMVHIEKMAIEMNPFVVFLWNNFGLVWGEIIRLCFIAFIYLFSYNRLTVGNEKQRFVAKMFIYFIAILWLIVITINLSQLVIYITNFK
jgi:hypothetical protein